MSPFAFNAAANGFENVKGELKLGLKKFKYELPKNWRKYTTYIEYRYLSLLTVTIYLVGGKPDDITVLVARVTECVLEDTPNT